VPGLAAEGVRQSAHRDAAHICQVDSRVGRTDAM
jgi:hypothetical protein